MEAKGQNGSFTVKGDKLVISRKGAGLLATINLGIQGDKVIPLSQITASEYKAPGWIRGYLRLSINGRDPVGGVTEAVRDENAIMLDKKHAKDAQALHEWLLDNMGPRAAAPAPSAADEIAKLAQLRDQGILTDAEFTAKKRQLLGI